jgi:hypothetical protein
MKQLQTELEAVVTEVPSIQTVFNPATLSEDEHLAYHAEIQYKRKPPQVRMIMCSRLDPVSVGHINTVAQSVLPTKTIALVAFTLPMEPLPKK